jgi:hypothetical protein
MFISQILHTKLRDEYSHRKFKLKKEEKNNRYQISKINYICKWIFLSISNFTIIEKMASRNSSEVVYIGDLSRHWIISKGTQIPKGIGWYKLKPATKPTVVVQSNLF